MPDYSQMTVKAQRHFCQTVPLSFFKRQKDFAICIGIVLNN